MEEIFNLLIEETVRVINKLGSFQNTVSEKTIYYIFVILFISWHKNQPRSVSVNVSVRKLVLMGRLEELPMKK